MKVIPLLLLALLVTGCSAVHVRDAPVESYFATRHSDVLTDGHLSASSRESLLTLGLDARACIKDSRPCLSRLGASSGLDDEHRLAALAELHLSDALAADRQRVAQTLPPAALDDYVQAARFSYAYLFFTARDPGSRAFEDRQTQVRDFYSFATERLTSVLFASVGREHTTASPQVQLDDAAIHIGEVRLRLPRGAAPQELLPASRLQVEGIRNTYRRDGFGAPFVAVAAPPDTASTSATLFEPLFLSATVVLRFPGTTLDEVLNAPDAMLDVYDPYRDETVQLGRSTVPLSANFTAAYALWLSRSEFRREAGRALFGRSAALSQPRIYPMQPYDPARRTIVMIHGLASSPEGWVNLVNEIMGDATLRSRYQVWEVFYPTNLPIPENVRNIRAALLDALQTLDPDGTAPASRHMTLVGHSMGGVIARLLVVDSADAMWQTLFDHPVAGEQRRRLAVLEPYLTLSPLPQVDRAIFLASPHRGSPLAHAWIGRTAMRFVRLPASILHTLGAVADVVATELPRAANELRRRQLSSVAYLSDQDRYLRATSMLPIAPAVTYHSIIGRVDPNVELTRSSDGVVPYASAHLDGAASEQVVTSGHSVQNTAAAILAIRNILREEGTPE
ncbi:MAG TPA: alpha/beta fold hydrolase [Steroidobacteraceae bacterium]|nr:alpha/beta fold hydrolase [Steroidobacteraceae bacterium]